MYMNEKMHNFSYKNKKNIQIYLLFGVEIISLHFLFSVHNYLLLVTGQMHSYDKHQNIRILYMM